MLIASQVEYLVISGHVVAYHAYPRPVADLDIWITTGTLNAKKTVAVLHKYGFGLADEAELFFELPERVIRIGTPPLKLKTAVSHIPVFTLRSALRAKFASSCCPG